MINLDEKNTLRKEIADDLLTYVGEGSIPDHLFELLVDYVMGLVRPDYVAMSVDWKKLPANVKSDLREAWDGPETLDQLEAELEKQMKIRTPDEVFETWLDYNGIINWSRTIRNALDGIRAAAKPRVKT